MVMVISKLGKMALRYADELDWYIFPTLEVGGKQYTDKYGNPDITKPKAPYTSDGFMGATKDLKTIENWWKNWPNAGIGISCGPSNLVVIDIDIKDGRVGFDTFYSLGIEDDDALHAFTPSGGAHIIFKGTCRSSASRLLGIDIRSFGAYIVAPPSILYYPPTSKQDSYGAIIGKYFTNENWFDKFDNVPEFPQYILEQLDLLKGKKKSRTKNKNVRYEKNHKKLVERARIALNRLSKIKPYYAKDYFRWLEIGMSLYSLGDDGFGLWVEWSQTCPEKFDYSACIRKWDSFNPKEITIGTLFHVAWKDGSEEL